jgi:hypothetical protein
MKSKTKRRTTPLAESDLAAVATDAPQLKSVLDIVAQLERLPVEPIDGRLRGGPDDAAERRRKQMDLEYAGRVGRDLATAVRRLLVPDYIAWAKARTDHCAPTPVIDRKVVDAPNRIEQAEALRQRLVEVAPLLHQLTRDVQAVVESGAHGLERWQERPFMSRKRPGDKRVFALVTIPVDVILHKTTAGFDVSYAFHSAAEGTYGSYGGDYSMQRRRMQQYPILVGAPATDLWAAVKDANADMAKATVRAQLTAEGAKIATVGAAMAQPVDDDTAAEWNVAKVKQAAKLRKAAKTIRETAEVTAKALEAMADGVSMETWPPMRDDVPPPDEDDVDD